MEILHYFIECISCIFCARSLSYCMANQSEHGQWSDTNSSHTSLPVVTKYLCDCPIVSVHKNQASFDLCFYLIKQ